MKYKTKISFWKKVLVFFLMLVLLVLNEIVIITPKNGIDGKARAQTTVTPPDNCGSPISGWGWGDGHWFRCATLSPNGFTLTLYIKGTEAEYGYGTGDGHNSEPDAPWRKEEYNYKGRSDYKGVPVVGGDIGLWVYKKIDENLYLAVQKEADGGRGVIAKTHHYQIGSELRWNEFAKKPRDSENNRYYRIVSDDNDLPKDHTDIPSLVKRVAISFQTSEPGARVVIRLEDRFGPNIVQDTTGSDKKGEISSDGTDENIQINITEGGNLGNLYACSAYDKDGKKYETIQERELIFQPSTDTYNDPDDLNYDADKRWGDFRRNRRHPRDKIVYDPGPPYLEDEPQLVFQSGDYHEVQQFSCKEGGEQTFGEENPEWACLFEEHPIACAMRIAVNKVIAAIVVPVTKWAIALLLWTSGVNQNSAPDEPFPQFKSDESTPPATTTPSTTTTPTTSGTR